jgi:hypothetical protein
MYSLGWSLEHLLMSMLTQGTGGSSLAFLNLFADYGGDTESKFSHLSQDVFEAAQYIFQGRRVGIRSLVSEFPKAICGSLEEISQRTESGFYAAEYSSESLVKLGRQVLFSWCN